MENEEVVDSIPEAQEKLILACSVHQGPIAEGMEFARVTILPSDNPGEEIAFNICVDCQNQIRRGTFGHILRYHSAYIGGQCLAILKLQHEISVLKSN